MQLSSISVGFGQNKEKNKNIVSTGGFAPPPINPDKALQDGIEGVANICKGLLNIKPKKNEEVKLATENGNSWQDVAFVKCMDIVNRRNAGNNTSLVDFLKEGGKITEKGLAINKNGLPFQGTLYSQGEVTDVESVRGEKIIEYDIYGRPTTILYHIPCKRNDVVTSIQYDENNVPSKTIPSETITPLGKGYETSPLFYWE